MGERRRYSRIKVPEKLRKFVGTDFIEIEHYDDGISGAEVSFWSAYYEIKRKEEEAQMKT